MRPRAMLSRALEHQVLEEVREPRAVGPLVLAADVVEHVAGDHRRGMVGREDDVQAVGQVVLGEFDPRGAQPRPARSSRRRRRGRRRQRRDAGGERGIMRYSSPWPGRAATADGSPRDEKRNAVLLPTDGFRDCWPPSRNRAQLRQSGMTRMSKDRSCTNRRAMKRQQRHFSSELAARACAPWRLARRRCLWPARRRVGRLRADEMTRRVQEELRKRNLYFGDVDGRAQRATRRRAAPLPGAQGLPVHRRGGRPTRCFPSTSCGPARPRRRAGRRRRHPRDELRRRPRPAIPASARRPATTVPPWPDITVLRSDEARPAPVARRRRRPPTPATAIPRPPDARAAARRQPGCSAADSRAGPRDFIDALPPGRPDQRSRGRNGVSTATTSMYFDEGTGGPAISSLRDITRYDHRWPERHFTLLDP